MAETSFAEAMTTAGITPPASIVADGNLHRFHIEGDRSRSENGWYVLHDDPPAGAFGDWKRDIKQTWSGKAYQTLAPEEKARYKANMEAARRAREQEQERIHAECRERAVAIWNQATPAPEDHPYLGKKQVQPHGLRHYKGSLVVPVRNGRELQGLQFIDGEGAKTFLSGTEKAGHYHSIGGKPESVLYLAEGYATAASIYEATGEPVAVCFDAGNLKPVLSVLRKKMPKIQIVICADNDRGGDTNTGVTKATEAAQAEGALLAIPQFPEGLSGTDFNDLAQACGLDEVKRQVEAAEPASQGGTTAKGEGHSEPLPLPRELLPVEPFVEDMLPEPLCAYAFDCAERKQTPVDLVAIPLVVALSAAVGRRLTIKPKQQDDWCVTPNLWGASIGRPSLKKSPAKDDGIAPLGQVESALRSAHEEMESEYETLRAIIKARKEAREKKVKDLAQKGASHSEIQEKILALPEPPDPPPAKPRLIVSDGTTEKLGELLQENPLGLLQSRDELIGWLHQLESHDRRADRAFFLEAWNGNTPYSWDRIGRGTITLSATCLAIHGNVTPGRWAGYVQSALKGGEGDDGFLQRFQLAVWPDPPTTWTRVDKEPNAQARDSVNALFRGLVSMDPEAYGASYDAHKNLWFVRFSADAQKAFNRWEEQLQNELRQADMHPAIESHLGKFPSLVPSLALLLHLAAHKTGPVDLEALQQALKWEQYLRSHMHRTYSAGIRADIQAAHQILGKIEQGKLPDTFKAPVIYQRQWAGLSEATTTKAGLEVLCDYGHLSADHPEHTGPGRPPESVYHLHPQYRAGATEVAA